MEDDWENDDDGGKSFGVLNLNGDDNGCDTNSGWDDNPGDSGWDDNPVDSGWQADDSGWIDDSTTNPINDNFSNDYKNNRRDRGGQDRNRRGGGREGGDRGLGRNVGGDGGGGRGNGRRNDNNQGGRRYGNNGDRNWNRNNDRDNHQQNGWENDWNSGNGGGGDDNNYEDAGRDRRGRGGDRNRDRRGRGGGGDGGGGDRRNRNRDDDNNNEETKPKREFYIPPEPTNDEDEIFNSGISSGINFDKYDKIPINVSGENVPPAIKSFEQSGLKDFILTNVQRSGYTRPTPVQKNAIPIIMEGRDLMGCAQTGSGKTAAFLLPIIDNLLKDNRTMTAGKPSALIIAPTRELAIQIFSEARKFSLGSYLKISLVYGGPAVKHQSDNITKGSHILVATVGRLLHFMNLKRISFEDIRFVVLDEADRMLDMGFIPDVEKIMEHPSMPSMDERQTLMFSATFPDDIQRLAGKFLKNYIFLAIGKIGGACTDVEQKFYKVAKFEKRSKLIELLEARPNGTIVFVETKRNADFLASLLSETKFPTTSIHGDRYQREREMALNDFKSGRMSVLIATSVAARGLDIKNVEHVINYDLPKSIDEYVHRIGRTGRVGNYGRATSLFDPEQDHIIAPELVKILQEADQEVPDFLLNAQSLGRGGDDGGRRYHGNRGGDGFGGRDVRRDNDDYDNDCGDFGKIGSEPQVLEPEEEW